jgi:hypothetical protein
LGEAPLGAIGKPDQRRGAGTVAGHLHLSVAEQASLDGGEEHHRAGQRPENKQDLDEVEGARRQGRAAPPPRTEREQPARHQRGRDHVRLTGSNLLHLEGSVPRNVCLLGPSAH